MLFSEQIIRYLGECKSYSQSEEISDRTKRLDAWEKRVRNIGIAMLVPALGFGILLRFFQMPSVTAPLALLFGVLGIFLWGLSLLIVPIAAALRFRSWGAGLIDFEVRLETYMKGLAKPLMVCAPEQLKYVDARLSERYDGILGRLTVVFGEKVWTTGIFALALGAVGWLGKVSDQASKLGFAIKPGYLVAMGVYFFLLGVILPVGIRITALRYQKENIVGLYVVVP